MDRNNVPSWYWVRGLHDAVILDIVKIELPYDYSKKDPIRNYCSIVIDSSNALFDSSIRELRFINAKILSKEDDYQGWWWVRDSVEISEKKIFIEITVRNHRDIKDLRTIHIQCENVVVVKNGVLPPLNKSFW